MTIEQENSLPANQKMVVKVSLLAWIKSKINYNLQSAKFRLPMMIHI